MDYSLGLALYDFLPGIFTAIALYFIAQTVRHNVPQHDWMAALGGSLVVAAGLMKASWKLIVATTGQEIVWLSELMFPLMGPGFALVAFAVWSSVRATQNRSTPRYLGAIALGIIALTVGLALYSTLIAGNARGYFPIFLMLASISNVALSIFLIRESLRQRLRGVALLFFLNIAMVFALQPIAAMPDKSIAIHWFEQTLTSGGAAAFALAAYSLWRAIPRDEAQEPLELATLSDLA